MGILEGKKGVVLGVANDHSIAAGVAQLLASEGAELYFNHLPDQDERKKMERRVRKVTDKLGESAKLVMPCDVTSDDDIASFFGTVKEVAGSIDFLVHSIAFAPIEDIRAPTIECSREGFKQAMDISVYSFLICAREAAKLMTGSTGSIVAMTYFGGEKVIPGYNMMGVCKSALDQSVRYAAFDLGKQNIRVNAISAGPVKTLAASAVGDFQSMMSMYAELTPLGRNITQEDVAKASLFLTSHLSSSITGEVLHVDCGYHIMGSAAKAQAQKDR